MAIYVSALQIERVGRALLGTYTGLPFALILQYLIFGEFMDVLSTCGAAIIMGSTCWIVLSKQKGKTEKHVKERQLSFSSNAAGDDFDRPEFDSDSALGSSRNSADGGIVFDAQTEGRTGTLGASAFSKEPELAAMDVTGIKPANTTGNGAQTGYKPLHENDSDVTINGTDSPMQKAVS